LCTMAKAEGPKDTVEMKDYAEAVARLRVFFGHQSVGGDIIEGLKPWIVASEVTENKTAPPNASFRHAFIGTNTVPLSKLESFDRLLRAEEQRQHVDVAMAKFCFIDFDSKTDVDALFAAYAREMKKLEQDLPQTTLVYFTVPLTTVQGGLRGWLKHHFGGGAWGEKENVKRNAFNELIRSNYPKELIFDLATFEATLPDGHLDTSEVDGHPIPRLRADFTDDGGHLNELGRREIAGALLRFLSTIPLKGQAVQSSQ
jgi:hypothetical protein